MHPIQLHERRLIGAYEIFIFANLWFAEHLSTILVFNK